jgi:antitoxin component of RelBE/YafQ-DinJ toxin-antitoxin module
MSETLTIALIGIAGTIISTLITLLITNWINKRKLPAEIGKLESEKRASDSNAAEKFQGMAIKQADENAELSEKLKIKEQEKKELKTELDKIRSDILIMDKTHKQEIEEVKKDLNIRLDEVIKENELLRDWASRLVMQLQSFKIVPTPYDIEDAKKKGLSLGEKGPC